VVVWLIKHAPQVALVAPVRGNVRVTCSANFFVFVAPTAELCVFVS